MAEKKYNFFESYHRALSRVPDDCYGRVVKAMSDYVFNGVEPNLTNTLDLLAWDLIKPILAKGEELSRIRANAGQAGGLKGKGVTRNIGNDFARQKQINTKSKANQKQNNSGIGKGIGEGIGIYKETTFVAKKAELSLEQSKADFKESIKPFVEKYGSNMCNDFFEYWTEKTPDGKKMRYQLQKTWEIGRRLARWHKQNQN
ncbi:MAG: hypothetical protein J6Q22_21610 [Prevotella sp.]|nr:hypothetical protein [Prevotella sp.]